MAGSLSATYFQSYQLAYQMCKQVERCYQFELGIQDSSFIQFGYWDSLYKGLLAGETLNHDLRRMQASYLQQNARRYELSRYVSLGQLNPAALQQLLVTGACDFTLPESLFDNDYPGHYNRRLTRVSLTVVYPNPGKFDNVKATLTLAANQVRINDRYQLRVRRKPSRLRSALHLQLRCRPAEDRYGQRPGRSWPVHNGNRQQHRRPALPALRERRRHQFLAPRNAAAEQRGRPLDRRRRRAPPLLHGP